MRLKQHLYLLFTTSHIIAGLIMGAVYAIVFGGINPAVKFFQGSISLEQMVLEIFGVLIIYILIFLFIFLIIYTSMTLRIFLSLGMAHKDCYHNYLLFFILICLFAILFMPYILFTGYYDFNGLDFSLKTFIMSTLIILLVTITISNVLSAIASFSVKEGVLIGFSSVFVYLGIIFFSVPTFVRIFEARLMMDIVLVITLGVLFNLFHLYLNRYLILHLEVKK